MNVVDIVTMDDYDAARAANPDALVRLDKGSGNYTLFFPDWHDMVVYEVVN